MAWTQQDTSFKKLQNKRITTSTGKGIDEEKGASSLELYLPDVKTELIPGTPPGASTSVLAYTGAIGQTLVVDTSVPGNLTWFASTGYGNTTDANNGSFLSESQRLGDWISDKYDGFGTVSGAGYEIKVYDANSNLITKADPSDWLFDYQTGILVFNNTSTTYGLVSSTGPFRVVGYRYIGKKGIISANYGGLGFTSYNLGDILVGAGSTFIKLPLGTNNLVLKVDTSSATGLTWGAAAASAVSTINGLTESTQYFITGTSGVGFNISSSGSTHTFNIPIAGVGATGLVSTLSQTFAGQKTFTSAIIGDLTGTATTAGFASTATYAHQSGYATTSGFATTASYSYQSGYGITSGFATTSTYAHQSGYGITAGFATTASYAHQSGYGITSGFATTASYSYQSGYGITSGFATSASYANQAGYGITAGFATTATYALQSGYGITSGFATTASYAHQSGYAITSGSAALATTATYAHQSGYAITSGFASTASYSYQSGYGLTSGLATTANYSHQSGYAITSGLATTSTYAYQSGYAITSGLATTAVYSYQSGYGITSGFATTAGFAHQAGYAITSGSSNTAGFATTASYAHQAGYAITSGLATTATYASRSGYATTSGFATTSANLNIVNASTGTFYPVLSNTASSTSGIGASVNSFFSFNVASGAFGASSVDILSGQSYSVGGNSVLSGTSLGTGVTNSSLTALGTITTGVWAGTSITAFYGGTGYSSYTKGDILVGAGSTFIRLNVGADNFVLTADNTTPSGVKWTSVAGLSITSVNGLNASAQFFSTGTSGTGFNISSSGSTHTFNIPIAGTGATGLVSTLAQSFAGVKTFTNDVVISSTTGSTAFNTGALTVYGGLGVSGQLSFNQAALGYTGVTNPSMAFIGSTTAAPITLTVLSDNSLLWEGTSGKLFGINNNLSSGWIFNVGDISGLPIIRANADGTIAMAEFAANVGIGLSNPSYKLHVAGDTNLSSSYVYRINGTSVLSSTSLGTGVTNSSLTSVGTIVSGTWSATAITALYGGTGLVPSFTVGDILYANTSSTWGRLTANSNSGYILTSAGSGATPTYVAPSSLSVGFATTSSYAYQSGYAITSGFATTSSYAYQSGYAITSGLATTASYAYQSGYAITSGLATTASNINVVNSSTNSAHTLLFTPTATGSGVAVSSNTTLSYNPSALVMSVSGLAVTAGTASSSASTGALVVAGGVGIGGSLFVGGDLTINGTTTTINSVTLTVDDKNIELGSVNSPSDVTAEAGGITLKGTTNKFINWYAGTGWSSSDNWNLASGNTYKINNTTVISSSSLGIGITNSSLTALGTITTGVWSGTAITGLYGGTGYSSYAKGDLLVGAGSTFIKLAVGSDNFVLTANSSSATGLTWSPTAATGITSLNGLTSSIQYFAIGYSGTVPSYSSSGSTHTLNIPIAGTGVTGLITGIAQTIAGQKTFTSAIIGDLTGTATTAAFATTSNYSLQSGYAVTSGFASTSTYAYQSGYAITSGFATTSTYAYQSGYAITSGTASLASTATYAHQSGYGITAGLATTATYSHQSGYAITSGSSAFATTATYAHQSGYAITSGFATTATNINVVSATTNTNHQVLFTPASGTASGAAVSTENTFVYNPFRDILSVSGLAVTASTGSTNSSTGALTVVGGMGIGGTVYTATDLNVGNTTTGRLYFSQATLGSAGTTVIPTMAFIGTTNSPITLSVLADNSLSFDGSSGQLFSINNNLSSGWIFAVNDISGLPLLRANADGTVAMGEFAGNIGIGISNPSYKLHVVGDTNLSSSYVYRINGTSVLSSTSLGTGVTNSSLTAVGTITTGTWSATAITAFYGGSGYQSYAVGDLLVGAGSTLYKLPVGTNNFVLTADSTAPGGVKWSVAASTGVTTINSLTSSIQYFATGISGSGFNISSSGSTHTFNIPIAGTGSTGLVSTLAQSFAGVKTFTNDTVISSSTVSTSTSTGALTVTGGVGIGGSLYTGTSTADSISGVVLNNGVITSGSWAGSTITSRYGGTGINTYIKGDILVGVGNTLITLPVGNDLSILTADSSTGIGLSWKGLDAPTYGAFASTSTQTVLGANTVTYVNFNTVYTANNISIGSGTTDRIYINDTGLFDVQFSTQFSLATGTQPKTVDMWFLVDGVPIPNSGTRQTVTGKDFESVLTVNLLQSFISGQYVQLAYSSPAADLTLAVFNNLTTPARPDIPSVILTVEPVSYITPGSGLAITGLASLNLLTSNAQTMVTGTSGVDFGISSIGSVHTFNIPDASTTARGLITTGTQTLLGSKIFASGVAITSTIPSTSTTTGAFTVTGGVGIGGSLYTGTSTADSISGVVLNNGVITTGSWSATAVTARYGGTGNTSYTLGDLLVGAGSTFIKLPVGINSYVLGADSSKPSGIGWTTVTPLTVSDTPPVSPKNADLWFNSQDGGLLVYYNDVDTAQWVEIALGSGIDLSQPVHITNTTESTSTSTGALIVDGGAGFASTIYAPAVSINGVYEQISSTLTTSTTTADQVAMSLIATLYRTIKLLVQVTSNTSYHSQEILLVHDGSTVYMTEYAIVNNGSIISTFDADISSGNIRFLVTPTNAVTTYKISCSAIRI